MRCIAILMILIILALIPATFVYAAEAGQEVDLWDILSRASTDPKVLTAFIIQLLMGIGLGYVSVKVAKYILTFIGILIIGSILSVWSLGGSIEEYIVSFGNQFKSLVPYIKNLLITLGILTVGPVTLGFIIGFIIGLRR